MRRTDERTDRRTDMPKLIVTFRNFAKLPKKEFKDVRKSGDKIHAFLLSTVNGRPRRVKRRETAFGFLPLHMRLGRLSSLPEIELKTAKSSLSNYE